MLSETIAHWLRVRQLRPILYTHWWTSNSMCMSIMLTVITQKKDCSRSQDSQAFRPLTVNKWN